MSLTGRFPSHKTNVINRNKSINMLHGGFVHIMVDDFDLLDEGVARP